MNGFRSTVLRVSLQLLGLTVPFGSFNLSSVSIFDLSSEMFVGSVDDSMPEQGFRDEPGLFYQNETDFTQLSKPGLLTPGSKIVSQSGKICSAGWLGRGKDGAIYLVTAGHCGNTGDQLFFAGNESVKKPIGHFIRSVKSIENGIDLGLVKLSEEPWFEIQPSIHLPPSDITVPPGGELSDRLVEGKTAICNLGWRSGLSCGLLVEDNADGVMRFNSLSQHGDSGGPVFALGENGEVLPQGIVNGVYSDDLQIVVATLLRKLNSSNGFTDEVKIIA